VRQEDSVINFIDPKSSTATQLAKASLGALGRYEGVAAPTEGKNFFIKLAKGSESKVAPVEEPDSGAGSVISPVHLAPDSEVNQPHSASINQASSQQVQIY